jgi:hypothetical protein
MPSMTTTIANFLITIKITEIDEHVVQEFSFNKRQKGIKCLFDNQYEGYYIFERMIKKYSLKDIQLRFLKREDKEDCILLIYDKNGEYNPPIANTYFTVSTKIPPFTSCEFCEFKEIVDSFNFKCTFKEKVMNKEVKKCAVFKQRFEL